MTISNRLKILIDVLGLKSKDFSRKTGIPYSTLLQYLSGKRQPIAENLQKITIHLKINLHWLLTGEGEMFVRKGAEHIDIKDIPLHNIKEWLDEFWAGASEDEKAWLKIEFGRVFPEFKEWLLKKQRDKAGDTSLPKTSDVA